MTKLEMILGTALIGVTTGYVYTVIGVMKHIKKEQQFLGEIQERCGNIKNILDEAIDVENEKESI